MEQSAVDSHPLVRDAVNAVMMGLPSETVDHPSLRDLGGRATSMSHQKRLILWPSGDVQALGVSRVCRTGLEPDGAVAVVDERHGDDRVVGTGAVRRSLPD